MAISRLGSRNLRDSGQSAVVEPSVRMRHIDLSSPVPPWAMLRRSASESVAKTCGSLLVEVANVLGFLDGVAVS